MLGDMPKPKKQALAIPSFGDPKLDLHYALSTDLCQVMPDEDAIKALKLAVDGRGDWKSKDPYKILAAGICAMIRDE